jgi:hypothetical protein
MFFHFEPDNDFAIMCIRLDWRQVPSDVIIFTFFLTSAGTNTHYADFRKSAGGFIHGFRYTGNHLFHNIDTGVIIFDVVCLITGIILKLN